MQTQRTAAFDQVIAFSSLSARSSGATGTFYVAGGGTNSVTNGFTIAGVSAPSFIDKGIFYGTGSTLNYAYYDSTGYVRVINYGTDANSAASGATASVASKLYQQITGNISAQANGTSFTTLNVNGASNMTLAGGATVTLGGILKNGNSAATISGGTGIGLASNSELVIYSANSQSSAGSSTGDYLTISTPILANGTNALTKGGGGVVTLSGANTYTGATTVNGGILTFLNTASRTGVSAVTAGPSGGIGLGVGGSGDYSSANLDSLFANTLSGFTMNATSGVGIDTTGGNFTYASNISGVRNLTKLGANTLTLTGSNTYSGATSVEQGVLNIQNSFALGTTAGSTKVYTGAALEIQGNISVGDALTLYGTGVSSGGVLRNISGNNTLSGTLTLLAASRINSDSGILTLSAATATNAQNLTFGGAGNIKVSTALQTGAGTVTKDGAGTLMLTGTNTYTGATTVSAGRLIATNASSLGGATGGAVTVAGGAALEYAAAADTQLLLNSTLGITGGSTTTIGGTIGATATSAEINVTGAITGTAGTGTAKVNIYGLSSVTPLAGTNTYTLLHSGVASTLSTALTATPALGIVYNNTNFTVGALAATTTDLTASITKQTALTAAYWTGNATSGINKVWAASDGSATTNWASTSGGAVQSLIPGTAADVTIVGTTVAATNTTLGANMTVKSLTIADATNGLSLNADGYALTITPSASTAGITVNTGVPASTIGANVVLGANQTWTNNSANALTVSGIISGSGTLTKGGTGTVILSGANTYATNTTINSGTLVASGNTPGVLASGNAFTLAGGTFDYKSTNGSANTQTIGNVAVTLGANTIQSEETGTGTSTLTVGTITRTAGATVNLTTGAGSAINSTVAMGLNTGVFYNGDYATAIAGGAVGAVVYGATASTANVSGTLVSPAGNTWYNLTGTSSMNSVNLQGGTIRFGGNYTLTTAGANSIAGYLTNGATAAVISGGGALRAGGEVVFATNGSSDVLTVSSAVTWFNATNALATNTFVTKSGAGKLVVSGTNTYFGNTTVDQGTLQSTSATGLGFGGPMGAISLGTGITTVAAGATLDLAPASADMKVNEPIVLTGASLTNSGSWTTTIDNGIAAVNLTNLGTGGSAATGTVAIGGTGSGANAAIIMTTSPSANGVISSLTLSTPGTGYTGTPTVTFTIAGQTTPSAATAILSSLTLNGANTIGGAGNLIINAVVADGTSSGGFSKTGAGALTLNGANTYSGGTTLGAGTLTLGNSTALGSASGALAVNAGTLDLAGNNQSVGSFSGSGGTVLNGSNGTSVTLTVGNGNTGGGNFAGVIANNAGGAATGTVALSVTGTAINTLTLSGTSANTYTGTTTVSGGNGNVGIFLNKTAGVNAIAGNMTLGNGTGGTGTSGIVQLQASNQIADTSIISMDGDTTNKRGTLHLGGFNETIGGLQSLSTNAGVVDNFVSGTSTLTLNVASGSYTFSGLLRDQGGVFALAKSGAGTQVISGTNTYTGGTTVSNGTLSFANGALGSSGNITVNGGTLQWNGSNTQDISLRLVLQGSGSATLDTNGNNVTLANAIGSSSSSSLTKSGAGNLALGGTNTYTGATTVNAGTLLVNGSTNAGSAFTVNSSGTLGGSGTIGGSVTVNSGGTLSPGNSPGVLTVSGPLTLAGNVNMELATGTRGTNFDGVNVGASQLLTYGGTLTLTMTSAIANATYNLFSFTTGSKTSSFSSIAFAGGIYSGTFSQAGDLWTSTLTNSQIFTFNQATGDLIAAVPEPSTWALLAFSLTTVVVLRRRRRD